MNYTSTELKTTIFPTRIVKTSGCVTASENLLIERPAITTMKETVVTRLEKTGAENPYVLLDFGKEIHGSLRVVVAQLSPGKKNIAVRLTFGESVSEALSKVGEKGATNDHSPRDFETLLSNLSNVEYGTTGFRFVRVELIEEGWVNLRSLVAVAKNANIEKKGYFRTNDELFNNIFDTAVYTCYLNLQDGVIWDGIKRDRLVWAGDLNSEIMTAMYLYGSVEHIRNSLDLLRDGTPEHRWMNTIPTYSAWWVFNHITYYRFWDDEAYFLENIPRINSILRDLDLCVDEDGENFDRVGVEAHMPYYLDWPTRDTSDAVPGSMSFLYLTAKAVLDLQMDGLDREAAASLAKKLEKYVTFPVSMKQTIALQALCGNRDPEIKARLEEGGARGFSTFMSYILLKGLSLAGSEKAVSIANEYYGAMLSRGATTFWEDFDMDWLAGSGRIDEEPKAGEKDIHGDYGKYCYLGLRHSFCHGWASGVVGWAYEELLGLKILEPGYKKISVSPNLTELEWIDAKIPTPFGVLLISAKRGQEPVITLPDGVELVK